MFYVVVGTIVVIALILLIGDIFYLKFQFLNYKISEANKDIFSLLNNKLDLMKKVCPLIRKEIKKKNFLEIIDTLEEKDKFELNNILSDKYKFLLKSIEENEKLQKSEKILELIQKLSENEINLYSTLKFYNNSVTYYNKLLSGFPSNIFGLIFRYKKKKFFKEEKHEIFEILNEEKNK